MISLLCVLALGSAPLPAQATDAVDPILGEPYTPTRPGQVTPSHPYWDLEVLYYRQEHKKAALLAEKRYSETQDPHLLLYIGRSWYQYLEGNEEITNKKQRLALLERGFAALEQGVKDLPEDGHLKFAYGVMLGRIGTTRGVLASLRTADDIERMWLDSLDAKPAYASIGLQEELPCDTYLALGIFYRLVPDYWIVKVISGTRGDLDKSLKMHQRGVACAGERIRNIKELAVTQLCIGTKRNQPEMIEAGKKSVNRYLAIAPRANQDFVDIRHGADLLLDPSIACSYSRDGQQDLDESKIQQ